MTRKLLIVMLAFALAAFTVAACGGDDDDAVPEPPPVEDIVPEEPDEEDIPGVGGEIDVEADPGGGLSYTTGELSVESGETTINFDNPASVPHDVRIEDADGNDVGGTEVIEDDSTSATVDLESGSYTYYCSVAGHRAGGMEEALEVE